MGWVVATAMEKKTNTINDRICVACYIVYYKDSYKLSNKN